VIAFDGDEMGKWVSGEKTPPLLSQLSKSAAKYFREKANVKDDNLKRPLSPSYHLQFSEALVNFGLYLVRPIIEHFNGQLIYSGGDDVLAMVPAASALDCAEALCLTFRGHEDLAKRVKDKFIVHRTKGGFVQIATPTGGQPNWPLIVPGPKAQASVGIAIGHAHSPLQNLVSAARLAEKRAKNQHERAACAVSLYKRSGEILEWGFKWESPALELFRYFLRLSSSHNKPPVLSGRFGYALNEWIVPYRSQKGKLQSGISDIEEFDPVTIIMKEVLHVVRQQSRGLSEDERKNFLKLCNDYLCHLAKHRRSCTVDFPMLFSIANFLQRSEE
jgi:CRISPR/Cas system-associated protein Cas10 (large subunit of type III CRISPR-Cas system)